MAAQREAAPLLRASGRRRESGVLKRQGPSERPSRGDPKPVPRSPRAVAPHGVDLSQTRMRLKSIIELDARLSSRLRVAEMPGFRRTVAMILAHSGDSWFWGAALVVVWLQGDAFWKRWAVVMLAAISILAAVVMGLKFIIRRRRPEGDWGSIYRNTDPHSFPSGHAARAFLIAALAMALGPAGLALAFWIWAPLVSLARVAMGVHYLSDVVAGSILGVFAGLFAWQASGPLVDWLTRLIGTPLW